MTVTPPTLTETLVKPKLLPPVAALLLRAVVAGVEQASISVLRTLFLYRPLVLARQGVAVGGVDEAAEAAVVAAAVVAEVRPRRRLHRHPATAVMIPRKFRRTTLC